MRQALLLSAVAALVVAKPELYKEKEDFQYSRSSSDEGTKAGFYGAQRGNMGGNYERAHNMDALAQHQMGGLVRTVQGELGDGANQRSGSVYTAANSRGMYGSGHYDLSNLEGRNFQEGVSYGDSQSQSQSYRALHNSGYSDHTYSSGHRASYGNSQRSHAQNSRYSGYNTGDNTDQALYLNRNLQSSDSLQLAKQFEGHKTADSGYYSQAGYQDRSAYGHTSNGALSSNGYGSHVRLISSAPARVYLRPGGTVTVPVAASLYEDTKSSSVDQNAINTEVDSLNSNDQQAVNYKPSNHGKHYESSYSYRKEWEKHSDNPASVPFAEPTISPYNERTHDQERVEQQETSGHEIHGAHSSHRYSGYNTNSASSNYQTAYNSELQNAVSGSARKSGAASSNAYTHGGFNHGESGSNYNGASGSLNNQVEDISGKPKSYHSSYSYHKSWERQGDPYIIKPSTNGQYNNLADGQTSQRLTSSSLNQEYSGYGSNQYYHHGHSSNGGVNCDDVCGHVRVARSYNSYDQQSQNNYDSQQPQNLEYFGQQSQNLEDFGQQSQNLEDFGQQSQNLEDFGQQSQKVEDLGQQSQNLEDFGQHSQKIEEFGQQSQNLEDFGQQSQNLEDLGQQSQNLQDFGQQSQNLEHFEQQSQKVEDLGQQSQNLEDFGQQSQKLEDLSQQTQNLEDFSQHSQNTGHLTNQWEQQSQTDLAGNGQETHNIWSVLENLHNGNNPQNFGQQTMETNMPTYGTPVETASHTALEDDKPNSKPNVENPDKIFNSPTPPFTAQETQNTQGINYWNSQQSSNAYSSSSAVNNYDQFYVPQTVWSDQINHQYNGYWNNQPPHQFYPMNTGNYYQNSYGSGSSFHSYTNSYNNPWTHNQENIYYTPNSNNNGYPYMPTSSTSPLSSLWEKLDNIEEKTISQGASGTYGSSHNGYNNEINKTESSKVNQTTFSTTTENGIKITTKPDYIITEENERGDIEPENKPQSEEDVGRGDIGPDDSTSESRPRKPLQSLESKPMKTPEEIESLSLTKEITTAKVPVAQHDQTQIDQSLSVISLAEQKHQEHKIVGTNYITSSTPKTSYSTQPSIPKEVQVKNNDNQYDNEQETQNFDQQSFNQFEDFSQQNVNTDQQNVNQQIFDFGQQSQDFDKQNFNYEQQNQNIGQQNTQNQMFDFNQQPVNVDQQIINEGKQHETQQIAYYGQNQHHQQRINNFEQHSNADQQNVEFGQQNHNLDQQNEQQLVDFGKPTNTQPEMVDFGQKNVNEEDFGQQIQQQSFHDFQHDDKLGHEQEVQQLQDWNQQNVETMEDLNQQVQNVHFEPAQQETLSSMTVHKEESGLKPTVIEPQVDKHKSTSVEVPLEPTTAKPGFWKRTKDKVASWFSSN